MKERTIKTEQIYIDTLWETINETIQLLESTGNTQLAENLLQAVADVVPMDED